MGYDYVRPAGNRYWQKNQPRGPVPARYGEPGRRLLDQLPDGRLVSAREAWTRTSLGTPLRNGPIGKIAKKLAADQHDKLIVSGYTDNAPIGGALQRQGVSSNQVLSEKRAAAVMQYMIAQGVKPDLVTAQGLGETQPIASNASAQGRAQNRRVEVSLAAPAGAAPAARP